MGALLVAALAVAGCEVTAQVRGAMDDGSETFVGTSTGYIDRTGWMRVTSSGGASCHGDYSVGAGGRGAGTFTCRDGRVGMYEFVSNGRRGRGFGTIAGKPFTFVFN